ncbi:MAG: alginate export family protein [Candidatus Latescibacteria bacterium]|nr:alginate export family protein [Candidatus Latescibacterota bacterium]
MKTLKLTTLFVILAMLMSVAAYAESCAETCAQACTEMGSGDIKVMGESRYRIQMDGAGPYFYDFDSDTNPTWFSQLRTRVGIKAAVADNMGVFAQFQDSRFIGAVNDFGIDPVLDMHQGYMWYKPCEKSWLKLGRFEMSLHNERLVGVSNWSMYGRSFDGAMFGRQFGENMKATFWATKDYESFNQYTVIDDTDGTDTAGDDMFYGINFSFLNKGVDVFAMMNKSYGNIFTPGVFYDENYMTFGAYSERTFAESFDYNAMFAMQTGTVDFGATEVDISGMLLNAEIGYTMGNGFRLAGLVDYTTGDDGTTNDKWEGFHNLYYTSHSFNGAMDLVNADDLDEGLMDIGLKAHYPVNDSWSVMGEFHSFATVEEYAADKTALGTEIDLSGKYVDGGFAWRTGLSMFSPSEDRVGPNADSQNWLYTQATMSF